jgi:uncharacterized surface protein with fasciclin (FAS1) repeats
MKKPTLNRFATPLALAMALGPLTALSLGTQYADEETWERAVAGVDASGSTSPLAAHDATAAPGSATGKNLLDVTRSAGVFDQFEAAIEAANMEELLTGEQPHTLFLPMDNAFARMTAGERKTILGDPRELRDLVESHIVPGRISATDLMRDGTLETINGKTLMLDLKDHRTVGNANVVKTESADNGVVHIIDAVIQS